MRQYDKIFVPADGKSQTDYYMNRMGDLVGLTEMSNQIVLTVEELRELCKFMVSEWIEVNGSGSIDADIEKDLNTYLASKGVTLTDKPNQ